MSSVCKSAMSCIDAHVPVRASYVTLYKWPESDAEFVRRRLEGGDQDNYSAKAGIKFGPGPIVVDSYYYYRQLYLRSYKFTRKESVQEKTRRCLEKVKKKAAVFSSYVHGQRNEGKNKKLKEGYNSVVCSLFHRVLSCTTSVHVINE